MADHPDDTSQALQWALRATMEEFREDHHPTLEDEFKALAAVTTELIAEMFGPFPEDGLAPDAERATKPH